MAWLCRALVIEACELVNFVRRGLLSSGRSGPLRHGASETANRPVSQPGTLHKICHEISNVEKIYKSFVTSLLLSHKKIYIFPHSIYHVNPALGINLKWVSIENMEKPSEFDT